MTTKRKSYKKLYLAEQARHAATQDRLHIIRRRLDEVNAALVPHGRQTLEGIADGDGPIRMKPLPFVASRAFMEANARVTSEDEITNGFQNYSWRGRPIHPEF